MPFVRYVGGPKDGERIWVEEGEPIAPVDQVRDGDSVHYHYVLVRNGDDGWQYSLRSVVQGS